MNKESLTLLAEAYGCDIRFLNNDHHVQLIPEESEFVANWYPARGKWFVQKKGDRKIMSQDPLTDMEDVLIALKKL